MLIEVQAVARDGFHGRWRAGRYWLADPKTVEVLDQDDDPPDVAMVDRTFATPRPGICADPTLIGRRTLRELSFDEMLTVWVHAEAEPARTAEAEPT